MRSRSRSRRPRAHRHAARPVMESLEQRLQLSHLAAIGVSNDLVHRASALSREVSRRHLVSQGFHGSASLDLRSAPAAHQRLHSVLFAGRAGRGARLVHRMSTPSSSTVTATSTQFSIGNDFAFGAALQTDGKIIVAGTDGLWSGSPGLFAVARYNPDLSLDTSFGSGGKQTASIGKRITSYGFATTIDNNAGANRGKILVAGTAYSTSYKGSNYADFAIARFTTSGALDTTFGGGKGYISTNASTVTAGNDQIFSVAIDRQDRIVAAGVATNGSYQVPTLARFTASGVLDTSFNAGGPQPGIVRLDFGQNAQASAVTIDGNGNYVIVGSLQSGFLPRMSTGPFQSGGVFVARYTPAGVLDTTFGNHGVFFSSTLTGSSDANGFSAVAIDAAGNIVASGSAAPISEGTFGNLVARFTPNGTLDPTFGGGNGWVKVQGLVGGDSIAIQPDGAIVTGGSAGDANGDYGFALERFLPDGSIDTSFNGTGLLIYVFPHSDNGDIQSTRGMVLTPSGKIVLAGRHNTPSSTLEVWGVISVQP